MASARRVHLHDRLPTRADPTRLRHQQRSARFYSIAGLFTEDGVWDGSAEGREGIRDFFAEVSKQVSFANHYVTNSIIDIDGDSAAGRWDLWQPMVIAPDPAALWLVAKYRERYVRASNDSLFKTLGLDIRALSPYEEGFAKQRFVEMA